MGLLTTDNFNKYKNSIDLVSRIYTNNNLLKDAENEKYNIKILLNKLKKIKKKIKARRETLTATEKLLNNRQENIDPFKTGIFPYIDRFPTKEESEEESEKIKDEFKKFIKYVENESTDINYDLFKDCFNFVVLSALAKNDMKQKIKIKSMS